MKILFVAAEAAPLAKVGGLGEVIGSLPKALNRIGHDVRLIMPRYGTIDPVKYHIKSVIDDLDIQNTQAVKPITLRVTTLPEGVTVYLVDSYDYSISCEIYGKDDLQRFLFFCRAVVEIMPRLDWQPEIIHCHDWHTALIPMWLNKSNSCYASVFTVHNLAYQGSFDTAFLSASGLQEYWDSGPSGAPVPPLNFMAQGVLCADAVTTVSKTYAKEILTPEYGNGLDQFLRYRSEKLFGVVNGIDYEEYNPASDGLIPARYRFSALSAKVINKLALQERFGLTKDADIPIVGMVTRLDEQKGLDILLEGIDSLVRDTKVQLIILGKGRERYHELLKQAVERYPQRVAAFFAFDDALAHLIYAGSDMYLMPSRFEPCGLGQMVAMRYGTVPVVRSTGGLADTVHDLTPDLSEGNGFVFRDYNVDAMIVTLNRALTAYFTQRKKWHGIMKRIMAIDFSWQSSARKYESIYHKALRG
jgi:starch synthase